MNKYNDFLGLFFQQLIYPLSLGIRKDEPLKLSQFLLKMKVCCSGMHSNCFITLGFFVLIQGKDSVNFDKYLSVIFFLKGNK